MISSMLDINVLSKYLYTSLDIFLLLLSLNYYKYFSRESDSYSYRNLRLLSSLDNFISFIKLFKTISLKNLYLSL